MFIGIHPLILLLVFIYAAVNIALLIIGCIIASGKTKSVKILGIGYIVAGIIEIVLAAALLVRYTIRNTEIIVMTSNVSPVLSTVSSLFGLICVCIFVHKNYGCKWIYFPLLAQPVVSAIASVTFASVFSRIGGEMMLIAGMGLSTNVTALVTGAVTAIILIVVFYKNRKAEKIIPHTWLIKLIIYCWSMVLIVASIVFYAICLSGGSDAERLYIELLNNFSIFRSIYTIINSFVGLVLPIYVLVMAKRAERKLEETAVYIEE